MKDLFEKHLVPLFRDQKTIKTLGALAILIVLYATDGDVAGYLSMLSKEGVSVADPTAVLGLGGTAALAFLRMGVSKSQKASEKVAALLTEQNALLDEVNKDA